jgi:uncharacterized protein YggU (UPF0235/DUF167 family)
MAVEGAANESIPKLVAGWLGVPSSSVRWVQSGRSPAKTIEVEGLSSAEVEERLRAAAASDRAR